MTEIIENPAEIESLRTNRLVWHKNDIMKNPPIPTHDATTIDLAVVSLWTPNIASWCLPYTENKMRYCQAWSLRFHGYDQALETTRAPNWSKILALQAHLHQHDWLFWADADTIVANFAIDVRTHCDPASDLIVTHDQNGLNNGTFLIRNTPQSHEYLRRVWEKDIRNRFIEQTAMSEVIDEMPHLRTKVVPKRTLNSYWNDYESGDFIFHTPGERDPIKHKLLRVVSQATRGIK